MPAILIEDISDKDKIFAVVDVIPRIGEKIRFEGIKIKNKLRIVKNIEYLIFKEKMHDIYIYVDIFKQFFIVVTFASLNYKFNIAAIQENL